MAKASLKPTRPTAGALRDTADQASETALLAAYRRAIEADDQAETDRLAARLLFPTQADR